MNPRQVIKKATIYILYTGQQQIVWRGVAEGLHIELLINAKEELLLLIHGTHKC
jgi:hypothetical protein